MSQRQQFPRSCAPTAHRPGSHRRAAGTRRPQIEGLERRVMLDGTPNVTLVQDINLLPGTAVSLEAGTPDQVFSHNGVAYFRHHDGVHGQELWVTDGTAGGTRMVKDIRGGAAGAAPEQFTAFGNHVYFVADGGTGRELWRTDGTSSGTVLVKDIRPGVSASQVRQLTVVGTVLYFVADDGVHGLEPWKTDGTASGTAMVVDLNAGAAGSVPWLAAAGGKLVIAGRDATGAGLWASNGSAGGTSLLQRSGVTRLTKSGNRAYFTDDTQRLWTTNGTAAGTVIVDAATTYLRDMLDVGGMLYYRRDTLKRVSSAGAGTTTLTIGNVPTGAARLTAGPNALYFQAPDPQFSGAWDTWRVDNGMDGAGKLGRSPQMLEAEPSGSGTGIYFTSGDAGAEHELWFASEWGVSRVAVLAGGTPGHRPAELTAFGSRLLLAHTSVAAGRELWLYDTAGTRMIRDVYPGTAGGQLGVGTNGVLGTRLVFYANDGVNGYEPWTTDGTAAGTTLLRDVMPGSGSSSPSTFPMISGKMLFVASSPDQGRELWSTDGTAAGTSLLKDIRPGPDSSDAQLARVLNGVVYFSAVGAGVGRELWRTDGTADGTYMVKDIRPGTASSVPQPRAVFNGRLYFSATDAAGDVELWATDGTDAGTVRVHNVNAAGSSDPGLMAVAGSTLYFVATGSSEQGAELWKTDGTATGTMLVTDLHAGSQQGSDPQQLIALADRLYFTAVHPQYGREMWSTDGTAGGTGLVADFTAGPRGSTYSPSPAIMNGRLYFSASDDANVPHLWAVDGNGTPVKVKEQFEAIEISVHGGRFFMRGADAFGASGYELWVSDGTSAGTRLVADLHPGEGQGAWNSVVPVGSSYYFVGDDCVVGDELFRFDDVFQPQVWNSRFAPEARQAMTLTFSEDVGASLTLSDVVVTNLDSGQVVPPTNLRLTYDPTSHVATITPSGLLPDGNYRMTVAAGGVADPAGNALAANHTLDFYVLAGDFNRDRVADFADLGILLNNYNTTGKLFGQGDANYDGAVDFADLGLLLNNYNKSLLAPAPTSVLDPPGQPPQGGTVTTSATVPPAAKAKPPKVKPKALR